MMNREAGIALVLVVLACASEPAIPPTPTADPESMSLGDQDLEVARLRYRRALDDSVVTERAPAELRLAGRELERGAEALKSGASSEDVALLAYRVKRWLDIAGWVAARKPGEVDMLGEHEAQAPEALQSIQAELEARYVAAERGDERLVVTLGRQLFEASDLRPIGKVLLERVAEILRGHPDLSVAVVGYTDNMGSVAYDQDVSQRRADAVASQLVSRGVAKGAMSVKGVGQAQPRVPNTTRAGRRLNRRVEVQIGASGS